MANSSLHDDVRLAHLLADNADAITMAAFKDPGLQVSRKADGTEVTEADRAAEESIRTLLRKARPRDAVHGEEGEDTGAGPRRWIIDPIDGTANFTRGVPVWATLIALEEDGDIVASCVSAPALNRRWWASREGGAQTGRTLLNGTELRVSDVARVEDCYLSYADIPSWIGIGRGQEFVDLMRSSGRTRAFGDFWHYMLVAEGAIDACAEPELALHDMAACSLIVTEAGGEFTNLAGDPGPWGPGAIATNGLLHAAVVRQLSGVDYTGPVPTLG